MSRNLSTKALDPSRLSASVNRRRGNRSRLRRHAEAIRDPVQEAKSRSLSSIRVLDWIADDDDDDVDESDNATITDVSRGTTSWTMHDVPAGNALSPLERLGSDLSATILQHLSVQEIARLGTLSRALYSASRASSLWKRKFQARWNWNATGNRNNLDGSDSFDWFHAYQEAYSNTDDLWITHWNCVDPFDGLSAGRCCISNADVITNDQSCGSIKSRLCPSCRYHPSRCRLGVENSVTSYCISTPAQAVAAATSLRLYQQQTSPTEYPSTAKYSPNRARLAFAQAATFHRPISTHQYQSDSLHFLSDLLFFQVHDEHDEHNSTELHDLKYFFDTDESSSSHNPHSHAYHDASATALHSWHLCHFTNPDYERPMVWRISIMRKDCFTVYPSEGYLRPGQSQVVVFGVRPLASLLAYATQQLNAHRESVDAFWANVYTEEAHLPPAPFLIHYHFATAHESSRATGGHGDMHDAHPAENVARDAARGDAAAAGTESNQGSHDQNTPWQRSGKPEQPVRITYLSAHVNVQYTLNEFRRFTMVPFTVQDNRTLPYVAPQLQEFHPNVARIVERWHLESGDDNSSVQAHLYRTEGPCDSCKTRWGPRLEELGQAFVVGQLEGAQEWQRRHQQLERLGRLLSLLIKHLHQDDNLWTERHHQVCVEIQRRLLDSRTIPWLSKAQRQVLCQWEFITDLLCLRFTPTEEHHEGEQQRTDYYMVPWRHAGVYKHVLCTDSVFCKNNTLQSWPDRFKGVNTLWKDEPKYLEAFAHLAHSPGRFCLGPQEDPNHLRSQAHSRYYRRQRGCVTDMFFDSPICGLQAALCVVSDPRSLMVHGIWDRVAYPGTLIRRPRLLQLSRLASETVAAFREKCRIDSDSIQLLSSPNKVLHYELQNILDMESLKVVDSWCSSSPSQQPIVPLYSLSLRNYLQNVPAPGAGRFALSQAVKQPDGMVQIQSLEIHDEGVLEWPSNGVAPAIGQQDLLFPRPGRDQEFDAFHIPGLHGRAGPRVLNLLWVLSSHLGWTVDDNQGTASVYVDRRILIGAQWLSISLMAAPLFWTLVARSCRWIPATPVDYPLQALPYHVETELRFLSEKECGYVSFALLFSWLCLGRWIERYTSRDFLRAMLEHLPYDETAVRQSLWRRLGNKIKLWCHRRWDALCPLFLQRMVFVPKWNRRSSEDLMKHIAFWRSNQDSAASHGSAFRAVSGGGFVFFDNRDGQIHLGEVSRSKKLLFSIVMSLASFSASSPHFYLNVLTVFSSSISLGLSMSLQSMETGRAGVTISNTGSVVEALSLVTIVILGFLVGQLVGSSGGVLFLAEFVVTSISLVLGGAGTISASAMESWGTFFCLAVTAFWGYLFGRVSIMEGIKQKQSGFSSIMLCLSLFVLAILWLIAIFGWKWESAIELVVERPEYYHHVWKWSSSTDSNEARELQ